MSELRQRPVASNQSHVSHAGAPTQRRRGSSSASSASSKSERGYDQDPVISVLDLIRVALALVVASCGLSYYMTSGESMLWGYRPWYTRWPVVVRWVVSNNSFLPHLQPKKQNILTPIPTKARPSIPNTPRTLPLQRLRPHPAHLPRRQRDRLRRLGQSSRLRSRRELQFLRRAGRHARVCDGLL
jgi:hypothetical protein